MNQSIISKEDIAAVRQLFPEHNYLAWDLDGSAWVFKFKPKFSEKEEMWVTADPSLNEDSKCLGDAMQFFVSGENAKLWIVELKTAEMLFQGRLDTKPKSYLTAEEKRSLRFLFPWAKYAEPVKGGGLWLYAKKPKKCEGSLSPTGDKYELIECIELKNWPKEDGHCECLCEDE